MSSTIIMAMMMMMRRCSSCRFNCGRVSISLSLRLRLRLRLRYFDGKPGLVFSPIPIPSPIPDPKAHALFVTHHPPRICGFDYVFIELTKGVNILK